MSYKIPARMQYVEKFIWNFTAKQFFGMLISLAVAGWVYLHPCIDPFLREMIGVSVLAVGISLLFLGLDRFLLDTVHFTATKIKLRRLKGSPVSDFLDIKDVRNGAITLKNGSRVSIIRVRGLNFSLYSDEDRGNAISSFREFLNSLDFPIQIIMKSTRAELDGYFDALEGKTPPGDRVRLREIRNARRFWGNYLRSNGITDKAYYVAVPLDPNNGSSFLNRLLNIFRRNGIN